ncbi:MAG: hypothetical protein IPM64_15215 [Phycisphaerales bacterium]|nr:hypothetical protein [Phycisphaerales bacterium]
MGFHREHAVALVLFGLGATVGTGRAALAAERLVPSQFSTIQAAINASANGDVVIVANGTYTGSGNENISFGGKQITVRSAAGPTGCFIGPGSTTTEARAFVFDAGEDAGSVLKGFTIRHFAPSESGGAVSCDGAGPRIVDCRFIGNEGVSSGGAVACMNAAYPTFVGCTFTGNVCFGSGGIGGGAISASQGCALLISTCEFVGNQSRGSGQIPTSGGAIAVSSGRMIVVDCKFLENTVATSGSLAGAGGAIYITPATKC